MKKLLLTLGVAAMLCCGGAAKADDNVILEKIALYIPNRIIDLFDCFSINLGVGPVLLRAELMATRACAVGGGYGTSYRLYKDYNRQYGVGIQSGWYYSLIFLGEEDMRRDRVAGSVRSYWETYAGVPEPFQRIYNPVDGQRDYWQFGGALGALIEAEVYLHPIEGFDFLCGIFFIDFKQDDLTFADFQ